MLQKIFFSLVWLAGVADSTYSPQARRPYLPGICELRGAETVNAPGARE